jgi:hypothetical protein
MLFLMINGKSEVGCQRYREGSYDGGNRDTIEQIGLAKSSSKEVVCRSSMLKNSGAYAELISIGPELVQILMSFPQERESNRPDINALCYGHSCCRSHVPARIA